MTLLHLRGSQNTAPVSFDRWFLRAMTRAITAVLTAFLCAMPVVAMPVAAMAHEAAGGFILLMPTEIYIFGAGLAVLASFLILAIVPAARFHRLFALEGRAISTAPRRIPTAPLSLLSLGFTLFLLYAALAGSDDPLTNPITLGVWTLGWIVLSVATVVFGTLWPWLNPWTGLLQVLGLGKRPILTLPKQIGFGVALVQMFYLVWIDLISLYATDPEALFVHVLWFLVLNGFGMILFGTAEWTRRAEPLHVLFALLAILSPFCTQGGKLRLVFPGARVLRDAPLSLSASAFVIFMLASGTFDGVSSTFKWLQLLGVNPLDFHGRSSVMWPNSLGLVGAFVLVALVFCSAIWLGGCIAQSTVSFAELAGRCVYTLVPIYVAYMLSHFATRLIMDAQYLWIVLSDPLHKGWDIFGTAHGHPSQSMFNTESGIHLIWAFQTGVITLGHIVAVFMAHAVALDTHRRPRDAVLGQVPLALLMVGYTSLGLWLLAAPRL
ncbi:hypothetical protein SAMN04488117_11024 [Celeribacter baekdonensis]|uniref:Uncharacterized protein n=1 Tax=Celeribacter baekdonensis TaxID=875171 RepID=A0A1G7QPQ3_9RHOB|nr:hypothetical protein [Celeribacter baekdonensis]SDG00463.1 hypothetical protein SAMN04488117_11024 [Celeribacter baekdonensis]